MQCYWLFDCLKYMAIYYVYVYIILNDGMLLIVFIISQIFMKWNKLFLLCTVFTLQLFGLLVQTSISNKFQHFFLFYFVYFFRKIRFPFAGFSVTVQSFLVFVFVLFCCFILKFHLMCALNLTSLYL